MTYIVTQERVSDGKAFVDFTSDRAKAFQWASTTVDVWGNPRRNGKVWEYKDGQLVEVPPPKPKRYSNIDLQDGYLRNELGSGFKSDVLSSDTRIAVEYDPETNTARILSKEEVEAL